jgi:hypothetical protein
MGKNMAEKKKFLVDEITKNEEEFVSDLIPGRHYSGKH